MADHKAGHSTRLSQQQDDPGAAQLHQIKSLIVQLQKSFDEHKEDMKKKLASQTKALKTVEKNLEEKLCEKLCSKIEDEVKGLQDYLDLELARFTSRLEGIEKRVEVLEQESEEKDRFNPEKTVVVINLPYEDDEDIRDKAETLIRQGLRCVDVPVVRVMRLESKSNKPGLVKVQLRSVEEKIKLLRLKSHLKNSDNYPRVFMRSSLTHVERCQESNMRLLLDRIPNAKDLWIDRNGRLRIKEASRQQQRNNNKENVASTSLSHTQS